MVSGLAWTGVVTLLLMACSVYDPAPLDTPLAGRGSVATPQPINGGESPTSGTGGEGGSASIEGAASAAPTGGSPASSEGGDVQVARCGDGRVAQDELCDTAIPAGELGACPTECTPAGECQPRSLRGTECQAECVLTTLACMDGDGCCPADCSNPDDDDCSASCGDGVVQGDAGETCEPQSPDVELAPADVCPIDCPDDGDPCTVEALTGSGANCNAACSTTVIEALDSADGCCPSGANSTIDDDCPVMCGNGVVEAGEDCDGGPGCDACHYTEQQRCIETFDEASASCNGCMCMNCTAAVNDCFDSGNATRDAGCAEIVYCGLAAGCRGSQCYCGFDVPTDGTCLIGDGPCAAVIERVAGASDALTIYNMQFDLNTAVGRAHALTVCDEAMCFNQCP